MNFVFLILLPAIINGLKNDCNGVPIIPNGLVIGKSFIMKGIILPILCYPGYNLVGIDHVLCQQNGSWELACVCSKSLHCDWPKPNSLVFLSFFDEKHGLWLVGNMTTFEMTGNSNGYLVHFSYITPIPYVYFKLLL